MSSTDPDRSGISLSASATAQLQVLFDAGLFAEAYQWVADTIVTENLSVDPGLDQWIRSATRINADLVAPDSSFIRVYTTTVAALEGIEISESQLQEASDMINNGFIGGILAFDGELPKLENTIKQDALTAVNSLGIPIYGWGGWPFGDLFLGYDDEALGLPAFLDLSPDQQRVVAGGLVVAFGAASGATLWEVGVQSAADYFRGMWAFVTGQTGAAFPDTVDTENFANGDVRVNLEDGSHFFFDDTTQTWLYFDSNFSLVGQIESTTQNSINVKRFDSAGAETSESDVIYADGQDGPGIAEITKEENGERFINGVSIFPGSQPSTASYKLLFPPIGPPQPLEVSFDGKAIAAELRAETLDIIRQSFKALSVAELALLPFADDPAVLEFMTGGNPGITVKSLQGPNGEPVLVAFNSEGVAVAKATLVPDADDNLSTLVKDSVSGDVTVREIFEEGKIKNTEILVGNALITNQQVGSIIGSKLGRHIAGNNQFAQIGASAALKTIAFNLGETLDQLIFGDNISAGDALKTAFADFPTELMDNLKAAGIGAISSYLTAEFLQVLGVSGVAAELLNTTGGAVTNQILSNLIGNVEPLSGVNVSLLGGALASYLGSKLANEIVSFDTVGGQLGAAIGGAIGSIVGTALATSTFTVTVGPLAGTAAAQIAVVSSLGPIAPIAIGVIVGTLLGGLIGSLFGGVPRSGADVTFDSNSGTFSVGDVFSKHGGSKQVALSLANSVSGTLNGVLAATGGQLLNSDEIGSPGTFGMRKSKFVLWPDGPDGNRLTFDDVGDLVNFGVFNALDDFKIQRGDISVKRALYNTIDLAVGNNGREIDTLLGNLTIGQDYSNYLKNSTAINALIAAEPDTAFTAGWVITLQRAIELGLNKRHEADWFGGWQEFLDQRNMAASSLNQVNFGKERFFWGNDASGGQIFEGDTIDSASKDVIEGSALANQLKLTQGSSTSEWLSAGQDVTTVVGKTYTLRFDVTGSTGPLHQKIEILDGLGAGIVLSPLIAAGSHSYTFTATSAVTSIKLFEGNSAGGSSTWNNVRLTADGSSSNLIANGDFGDGLSAWTLNPLNGGIDIEVSDLVINLTHDATGGNSAGGVDRLTDTEGLTINGEGHNQLKLTQGSSTSEWLSAGQDVTTEVGKIYTLRFDVTGSTGPLHQKIEILDGLGAGIVLSPLIAAGSHSYTFTATSAVTSIKLFEGNSPGGSSTWDNVRLTADGSSANLIANGDFGNGLAGWALNPLNGAIDIAPQALEIDIAAQVFGGAGNDTITGGDLGNDLFGEAGDDVLIGGKLDDWIFGGAGNDTLYAGDAGVPGPTAAQALGADGGSGNYLDGGDGNDIIYGSTGSDWLEGGDGVDELRGGADGDIIAGGAGNDVILEGGAGDDQYIFRLGDGVDVISDSSSGVVSTDIGQRYIDIALGIQGRIWEGYDQYVEGDSIAGGTDTLVLGPGIGLADVVFTRPNDAGGNPTNDMVVELWPGGVASGDQITLQNWFDDFNRIEKVQFADGQEINIGHFSTFTLGTSGNDVLLGTNGNDFIHGGDGNDEISLLFGHDFGNGGRGDDLVSGDSGNDIVLGADGDDVVSGGLGIDTVAGGRGDDDLSGGGGNDILAGEAGNDMINTGDGDDIIKFGRGDGHDVVFDTLAPGGWQTVWTLAGGFAPGYAREGDLIKKNGTEVVYDGERWVVPVEYNDVTGDLSRHLTGAAGDGLVGTDRIEFDLGINIDQVQLEWQGTDLVLGIAPAFGSISSFADIRDTITLKDFQNVKGIEELAFFNTGVLNLDGMTGIGGGSDLDDIIVGSAGTDWITGNAGDDDISGGTGNDFLFGNEGSDIIRGDAGADVILGGRGNDILAGGSGGDTIIGGSGHDLVSYENEGASTIHLDAAFANIDQGSGDRISGVEGVIGSTSGDLIYGNDGANEFDGRGGDDTFVGDAGDDLYVFNLGDGQDTIIEGRKALQITAILNEGGILQPPYQETFESVWVEGIEPTLYTNTHQVIDTTDSSVVYNDFWTTGGQVGAAPTLDPNLFTFSPKLSTGNGQEFITYEYQDEAGDGGDDTLSFGAGITLQDLVIQMVGNDLEIAISGTSDKVTVINFANADNRLENLTFTDGKVVEISNLVFDGVGTATNELLVGTSGIDTLTGAAGADTLTGDAGDDILQGGDGDDLLVGGAGADSLNGGNGDDILEGGAGADVIDGGIGIDTASYANSSSGVIVDLLNGTATFADAEGDTLIGIENLIGSVGPDTLVGEAGDNAIDGGLGNDSLWGFDGDDAIRGGDGNDHVVGQNGNDILAGNSGDDHLEGRWGNDTLIGGAGNDTLDGGGDVDVLVGGDGDDILIGGLGSDSLEGGIGNDTLGGSEGNDSYLFSADSGSDTVTIDTTLIDGGSDEIVFDASVSHDQLWFTQVANDLKIEVIGGTSVITVKDWFLGSTYQALKIHTFSKSLHISHAQNVISAMAGIALPATVADIPPAVSGAVNANWYVGETPAPVGQDASLVTDEDTDIAGQIVADDPDDNITGFATEIAPSFGTLVLDTATGAYTYTPDLNFNGADSFQLSAVDADGSRGLSNVVVTINSVNDDPSDIAFTGAVDENAPAGTVVGTATATDPDVGDTLTFSLFDDAGGRFVIDNATGVVTVATGASLDFEQATSHTIQITATDQTGVAALTEPFTIGLSNVNEAPTAVSLSNATVLENVDAAVVGTLSVADIDAGDTHTYTVDDARFETVGAQLQLKAGLSLDHEAGNVALTVTATDSGGLQKVQPFTIVVADVNEAPTDIGFTGTAVETDPNGASVGTATASDPDAGETFTFALQNDPEGRFAINPITGEVTIANAALIDAEVATQHTITIEVKDSGGNPYSEGFTVTVVAVNEAPTITDIINTSFSEDTSSGAIGFTISDPETAAGALTVTKTSSNQSVIADSGIVLGGTGASRTITLNPVANASGSATITVTVSDGNQSTSDTFLATVNAVNDLPTVTAIGDQTTNEDTPTALIPFTIADVETAATSLSVTAISDNDALFDPSNIVLGGTGTNRTIQLTPDANAYGAATVTVTVDDGTTAITETFKTTVAAVNDNPEITGLSGNTVSEAAVNGTVVGTAMAQDPDDIAYQGSRTFTEPNIIDLSNWQFSAAAPIISGWGWVNSDESRWVNTVGPDGSTTAALETGQQNTSQPGGGVWSTNTFTIDPNQAYRYSIFVQKHDLTKHNLYFGASDDFATHQGYVESATTGADNFNPYFVAWGTSTQQAVLDPDKWFEIVGYVLPEGHALVAPGSYGGVFDVSTGEKVADTAIFRWNDNRPDSDSGFARFFNYYGETDLGFSTYWSDPNIEAVDLATIPENQPANTLTYSLFDSAGGRFAIDGQSGAITVANSSSIDFEAAASYNVTVRATDGLGGFVDQDFAINVTDVDEAPVIGTISGSTASEGAVNGTIVGTVSASDPEGSALTYSLTDTAEGRFAINPTTGVVTIASSGAIDYEDLTSHSITAHVSDGIFTDDKSFTINVTDANDAPVVNNATLPNINENSALNTLVGNVGATDPDDPASAWGQLSYSFLSGNEAGKFAFDQSNGDIIIDGGLDFEATASYALVVRATDGGGNSNDGTITINVTDLNETPVLPNQTETWNWDKVFLNDWVGEANATDPDAGLNGSLVYELTHAQFYIDTAGAIRSKSTFDVLYIQTFTVTPTVRDRNGDAQSLSDSGTISITFDPPGGGGCQLGCGFPIVLDLDGDGVELVSVHTSQVEFDINDDGFEDIVGWAGADDGFLALDRDGNGKIDKGNEISFVQDLEGATTDLEGLAAFDTNNDGVFDAQDDRFGEFVVWRDADLNGRSDPAEMMSLAAAGITGIGLDITRTETPLSLSDDNLIMGTSDLYRADGTVGLAGDVALFYFDGAPGNSGSATPRFADGLTGAFERHNNNGNNGNNGGSLPPVLLDLDGDGVELIGLSESKVVIDADLDGLPERTGWVGPDDGILAHDFNGNGRVDDVSEISFVDYLPGAATDLEALRAFDTNGNGYLDPDDERFAEFGIWQDRNSNGRGDEGEFVTLSEAGIHLIDLNSQPRGTELDGNIVNGVSTFTRDDGSIGRVADVSFGYEDLPDFPDNIREQIREALGLLNGRGQLSSELGSNLSDILDRGSFDGFGQSGTPRAQTRQSNFPARSEGEAFQGLSSTSIQQIREAFSEFGFAGRFGSGSSLRNFLSGQFLSGTASIGSDGSSDTAAGEAGTAAVNTVSNRLHPNIEAIRERLSEFRDRFGFGSFGQGRNGIIDAGTFSELDFSDLIGEQSSTQTASADVARGDMRFEINPIVENLPFDLFANVPDTIGDFLGEHEFGVEVNSVVASRQGVSANASEFDDGADLQKLVQAMAAFETNPLDTTTLGRREPMASHDNMFTVQPM